MKSNEDLEAKHRSLQHKDICHSISEPPPNSTSMNLYQRLMKSNEDLKAKNRALSTASTGIAAEVVEAEDVESDDECPDGVEDISDDEVGEDNEDAVEVDVDESLPKSPNKKADQVQMI
jgi:hypothetical protein